MSGARSRPRPAPPVGVARPRRALTLAILVLRLFAGAFFLDTAFYKLVDFPGAQGYSLGETFAHFRDDEYVPTVEHAIAEPPEAFGREVPGFTTFLREVMLPGADVFAPAVLVGEALLGVSLVLGAFVRLSASLGFLMMLSFSMAKFVPAADGTARHPYLLTVHSANWPVTAILLALALAAAGRWAGLDLWLRWTT